MLGSEGLESFTTEFPCRLAVLLHCSYNMLLLDVIHLAEALSETVDVEHDEIGQQSYNDNNIDKRGHVELVINAPERLRLVSHLSR